MRKVIGILAAVALVLAVTHAQEKPGAPPDDKLLIVNERALLEVIQKADKASYQSLILPEGTWTDEVRVRSDEAARHGSGDRAAAGTDPRACAVAQRN